MGRASRVSGHAPFRRPVDLTGVISIAEKNDLTTLVSAITDKMHNDVSAIFDSPLVGPLQAAVRDHHAHRLPFAIFACHRDAPAPSSHPGDGSWSYAKVHHVVEKEEADAMTPQLCELKKEALAFFRKWQNALVQRIREIHIHEAPPRGRGARGGHRGRGARVGLGDARTAITLAIGTPSRLL